ncbi:hypothetical protein SORBI_3009G092850 [Sorghum bicolor]|uniref:CCHC-type domain-containing protein n=1 Tax=Sorghum bicolor TaxID=4558 RepID=A0A1Z5R1Q6_SORBI|nr:hypothetical protein SORBI_3009G092850 [Sorghum bicolor]
MAAYGLDDCETHIFYGTNFALWKNHMLDHFRAKRPKFWWVVTNGLTHNLDQKNLTNAQKVLFELDCEAYDYLIESLSFESFDRINSKGTAYEMWESIKHTFGDSSTWDDGKFKKEEPKVEIHEVVEHDHNMVVVEDCSTSWSSDGDDGATTRSLDKDDDDATSDANDDATLCTLDDKDDGYESDASTSSSTTSPHCFMSHGDTKVSIGDVIIDCDGPNFELELKLAHEELCVAHDNLVQDNAFLTKKLSNKETKTSESSSFGSNDQSHIVTIPCDVDACSTSMYCETNLLKENNELKNEVKNLSNKLERCYYSKVTFEHILKTQKNYGDKCGLGFKKKMTKGDRKQEKKIKKLHQKKLCHTICYRCHEAGHLANGCPNIEKLMKMKEEERLKHVKSFKCRTWGYLISMCPTKQLVKHQVKSQPKPQVEQDNTSKAQVKIYHKDGGDIGMMKKKKTRRGGRKSRSSKDLTRIKCFECKNEGHFASKCSTKLEKKAKATHERQVNEKQHMRKEEKAQSKRSNC